MQLMPTIFLGHGNPMNAISANDFSRSWAELGKALPKPSAILAISAHWYIGETAVTVSNNPPTIHDFGGFPKELYAVQYKAPGSTDLAKRVQNLLAPLPVGLNEDWGLDHGAWSVLLHLFPEADIPVVQLSIDSSQPPEAHFRLGQLLKPLREEDILVVGSGNIVHNLSQYDWNNPQREAFPWASRFENRVVTAIREHDDDTLIHYQRAEQDALLSVPTAEHYLPLLYIAGLRRADDVAGFPVSGVEGGAISMLAVQFGS
jgi:4,5-DOPA dioxygenase extradiol